MDDIDRQLLAHLRDDARMSVVTLSKRLKLARATVQNRICKLEQSGVIVGYTVRLRPLTEPYRIRAIMSIEVAGQYEGSVTQLLRGQPEVTALYTTNGRWDLIAEVRTDSLEAFDRVLGAIRSVKGITRSETSLLLSTHKV